MGQTFSLPHGAGRASLKLTPSLSLDHILRDIIIRDIKIKDNCLFLTFVIVLKGKLVGEGEEGDYFESKKPSWQLPALTLTLVIIFPLVVFPLSFSTTNYFGSEIPLPPVLN